MQRGTELRWVVEGFDPDTIPFVRLALYMTELAKLFGEDDAVRFVRLENNCVAVVNRVVKTGALSRLEAGLRRVGTGNASKEKETAYRHINDMLAEDRTRAYIKRGSAIILRFPGIGQPVDEVIALEGVATLTGYLYHLSENPDGLLSVRVRQTGQIYARCVAPNAIGPELKDYLFSTVRLTGKGRWVRSSEGVWSVSDLTVTGVRQLKDSTPREAFEELRRVKANWSSDPLGRQARLNQEGEDGE